MFTQQSQQRLRKHGRQLGQGSFSTVPAEIRAGGRARKLRQAICLGSVAVTAWALAACGPFGPAAAPPSGQGPATESPAATVIAPTATVVAGPAVTVTVVATERRQVSYQGVSFQYPADLAQDAQGAVVADDGAGEPPWTRPVPSHVEIALTGYVLPGTAQSARIIIYPVDEFAKANGEAASRIAGLRGLLERGGLEPGATVPFLPLVNALGPLQAQVAFLSFEGGHGVRYLTQLDQGPVPVNNQELCYTFQALTDDGRYYVAALLPVSQGSLPADAASLPPAEREAVATNYRQYLDTTARALNAQSDAGFTPALSALDALVESIKVGVPAGDSLSGRVQWGEEPVAGVRVELRKPGWRNNPGPSNVVATALTDTAGQYVIRNPPAGDWSLCAVWPDGEENQGGTPAVQVASGQVIPAGADTTLHLARTLKLLEPALGDTVELLPALRWEDFPGAGRYQLWVSDAGTTELVVQQVITGTVFQVTTSLLPGTKYDVSVAALGAADAQLAIGRSEFWTGGARPATTANPADAGAENLPPACKPHSVPGSALYADPSGRYCFLYPAGFEVETSGLGQQDVELGVFGPALDTSADPLRAAMLIAVTPVEPGTDLKSAVDGFLQQFEGMPVPAIERKEYAFGGGPAELVEVVPGLTGSSDIFALGSSGDTLYHFIFEPSVRDFPQAQADFEELFNTLNMSFTFLRS